jgi:hypothetical protein
MGVVSGILGWLGWAGILAAGIVLAVLGGMFRRKSGCGCCCGGDHSE